MSLQRTLFSIAVLTTCLAAFAATTSAQGLRLYQEMSPPERASFISEQARRIGQQMSGNAYEFTPAFEAEIEKAVEDYAARIGRGGRGAIQSGDRSGGLGRSDLRAVFERGRAHAPLLIGAFRARNLSPLMGLYLPLIESEYRNAPALNAAGAVGMFQFLPRTGELYGLSPQELLDVEKSADAAARYLSDSLARFKDDAMKEALALLSFNRGRQKIVRDLQLVGKDDAGRRCAICALTAARTQLDETFQKESVHYVPGFFAAAIIGENPQAFGLSLRPLSSYEATAAP
ncbi:MAG TPA: transglycosylase SLT domain-containing protein [Pyrinomonadaceae bacterium]|jgi:hypothetical protein